MVNSIEIEYLEPKNEFRVGSVKNIAVPSNNKDDIKKMYPNSKKSESNADMLSQSFNATPLVTPIPQPETNIVENVTEPVQISPIPVVQNTNLESEPVNLDMSVTAPVMPSADLVVPEFQPIQEPMNIQQTPIVENNSIEVKNNDVAPTNVMESQISSPVIESAFKVSDAPNIFDNPVPINTVDDNIMQENTNMFNQPLPKQSKEPEEVSEFKSDINDDIISAEIAILENDIKHYEGLAENNRKKIELLKKQIRKEETEVSLENTASNLFNSSGVLDDEKVLGKTPMPNLRAA